MLLIKVCLSEGVGSDTLWREHFRCFFAPIKEHRGVHVNWVRMRTLQFMKNFLGERWDGAVGKNNEAAAGQRLRRVAYKNRNSIICIGYTIYISCSSPYIDGHFTFFLDGDRTLVPFIIQ